MHELLEFVYLLTQDCHIAMRHFNLVGTRRIQVEVNRGNNLPALVVNWNCDFENSFELLRMCQGISLRSELVEACA